MLCKQDWMRSSKIGTTHRKQLKTATFVKSLLDHEALLEGDTAHRGLAATPPHLVAAPTPHLVAAPTPLHHGGAPTPRLVAAPTPLHPAAVPTTPAAAPTPLHPVAVPTTPAAAAPILLHPVAAATAPPRGGEPMYPVRDGGQTYWSTDGAIHPEGG